MKSRLFNAQTSNISEAQSPATQELTKSVEIGWGNASAAFGKLLDGLWNNRHVSIRVKCKVYRAIVLSTLLYGPEAWTIYRNQVKKLHALMMRQHSDIIHITWKDKVTNLEILSSAGLLSLTDMLIEKGLKWLEMESDRLPRQLLHSQLCKGRKNQGRSRLKDVAKRNMK